MKEKIIIREAKPQDAALMLEYLYKIGGESDFLTFGQGELKKSEFEEKEFIENAVKSDNALFLVAEAEGKIVGNLNFAGGKNSKVRHTGEFGVSVLKEYWGQRIGKKLIERLIAWSKEASIIRKINLRVRTDNLRAIALYEDLGFIKEGIIKRDFFIEGKFYDSFSMGLFID
ncbi:GNAT family N-acetyltransferase [Clostridium felsineum]|uniref:Spermidine N(1)-acetyltransferase n=1 Tax=Clostridium felsineum TaxID=36839 RepID=A0A1S8L7B2_9CLOT|nr:GNAT family protein [Clostridium felsineum]URZ07116.1 Spermidine N(1)-acetyltransferase [Clostridium felsineum]URZ12146.1 Spermidine N(1)-acetyltransferase [Clostridium felsineum]